MLSVFYLIPLWPPLRGFRSNAWEAQLSCSSVQHRTVQWIILSSESPDVTFLSKRWGGAQENHHQLTVRLHLVTVQSNLLIVRAKSQLWDNSAVQSVIAIKHLEIWDKHEKASIFVRHNFWAEGGSNWGNPAVWILIPPKVSAFLTKHNLSWTLLAFSFSSSWVQCLVSCWLLWNGLKEFKAAPWVEAAQSVPVEALRWDTGQRRGSSTLTSEFASRQERAAIAPRWECTGRQLERWMWLSQPAWPIRPLAR